MMYVSFLLEGDTFLLTIKYIFLLQINKKSFDDLIAQDLFLILLVGNLVGVL